VDAYFVTGKDWDEIHVPGDVILDEDDEPVIDDLTGLPKREPSVIVAKVAWAAHVKLPDVAQAVAESLNAIEHIEAVLPDLPVAVRNGPKGKALTAAIEKAKRAKRP
jgi:hypothetical protein